MSYSLPVVAPLSESRYRFRRPNPYAGPRPPRSQTIETPHFHERRLIRAIPHTSLDTLPSLREVRWLGLRAGCWTLDRSPPVAPKEPALPKISVVQGDIARQSVDAIVNAANRAVRGGGGVDGAIHRAGGPIILQECIDRFPVRLEVGDAGWTTAGRLPSRWVIHTVGPNYRAGHTDRRLLESCYRRSLEVADVLGAQTVAFPLLSAGVYGWPIDDAVDAAIESIWATRTAVASVTLVAFDDEIYERMRAKQGADTPRRILEGVARLHERGYEQFRILPYMSPSGMHWRVEIAEADAMDDSAGYIVYRNDNVVLRYSTSAGPEYAGAIVDRSTTPDDVADLILASMPWVREHSPDRAYTDWYARLMNLVTERDAAPIAFADYYDTGRGWEVGWGSGAFIEAPPPLPR